MLSKVIFRSLSGKYFLDLVLSAVVLQDDQDSCFHEYFLNSKISEIPVFPTKFDFFSKREGPLL